MLVEIEGISIDFPFEPYQIQKDYMKQVLIALKTKKNAVLESPTGTGKTLCLLTSTLAWLTTKRAEKKYQIAYEKQGMTLEELNEQKFLKQESWNENDHKIVYTSRTHSQLAQVMKEMKFTSYNEFNGVALGSRDQLCINEDVMKATSMSEKIHLCRSKVKAKQCKYHGQQVDRAAELPRTDKVLDIEDLIKTGKSCGACPYYLAKKVSENADIIFLPYNYILDFRLLKSFQFKLKNSVVIFDEAHNVEKVCQDAASYQISSSDIATCIDDITHIMKQLEENQEKFSIYGDDKDEVDISTEDCALLKETLLGLEQQIDKIDDVTSKGKTFHGAKIFELLQNAKIVPENSATIVKLISSMYEYLNLVSAGKTFGRKGFGLAKMMEFLEIVYGFKVGENKNWMATVETAYRLHVEREEPKRPTMSRKGNAANSDGWLSKSLNSSSTTTQLSPNAKVLNYWCFNPGLGLKGLLNREIHCIILTSGTLSPIKPLIGELDLNVDCQLENSHIIKSSQVFAKIIPQGPDGTMLNAGYQNRDNPKYLSSLAFTIKTIAQRTPNGLLVFFPSYVLMNKTQETWKQKGLWDAIHEVKPIFTEPKNKNEFESCISEYYAAVKTTRGAIFMAVLRGKVSEGLDFKDENGRAVIIIGLPFAPYLDPRVVLKKEYLDRSRTQQNMLVSGQDWYNMDATRAVNQAIGRVIRHKDDYGAILLCDSRFSNYKSGLSKWIQSHLNMSYSNEKFMFGPIIRDLGAFFKAAASASSGNGMSIENNNVYQSSSRNSGNEREFNQKVDGRVNTMIKQQIKLENSNEVYSRNSSVTAQDQEMFEEFVRKDVKPLTIFSDNVNSSKASSIDFNAISSSPMHYANYSKNSSFQTTHYSQDEAQQQAMPNKKRKFTVTTNSQAPNKFVFSKEPVKVQRIFFERIVPSDRKEFLELTKVSFDTETYKYILMILSDYHAQKDWTNFWTQTMPVFKYHPDQIFILLGLRRFLIPEHKRELDDEMKKHFTVE